MDFGELLNNIVGSEWFTQLTNYLQMAALMLVAFIVNKVKTKFTTVSTDYTNGLKTLKEKLGVTENQITSLKNVLTKVQQKLDDTNETNQVLLKIMGLFLMDSKSIAANTKLEISKLLNKVQDKEIFKTISVVVEASKEEEKISVEEVEEIKQQTEEVAEVSNANVDSIAQQTLDIYNDIVNE